MERFITPEGVIFEKDGSKYYRSTGHTDPKGNPIMMRVAESIYEGAEAVFLKDTKTCPQETPEPQEGANFAESGQVLGLSVSVPDNLTDAEWERTAALFQQKLYLERHAFQSEDLDLKRADGKITLSGSMDNDPALVRAATLYLTKLIDAAKAAQRVNHTGQYPPENERFAFRTWLIRLNFIGKEYKEARETLLKHLPGSSAYRDRKRKEEE